MAGKNLKEERIIEEPPTISEIRGEADNFEHKINFSAIATQAGFGLVFGFLGLALYYSVLLIKDSTIALYLSMTGYLLGCAFGVFYAGKKYEPESSIGPVFVGTILGLVVYCSVALITIDSPTGIADGVAKIFSADFGLEPAVFIIAPLVLSIVAFYFSKFDAFKSEKNDI